MKSYTISQALVLKKEYIEETSRKYHLGIMIIFIITSFFMTVILHGFSHPVCDYMVYYNAARYLLEDGNPYLSEGYYYLPSFAFLMLFFLLFDDIIGSILFFILFSMICWFLVIREFDKSLLIKKITCIKWRFFLLTTFSFPGQVVILNFANNQTKIFTLFLMIFVLRRELQGGNKNFSYHAINYFGLSLVLAMCPYLIFIILIFLFHDFQMKKIMLFTLILVLQNLYFIINLATLFTFLEFFGGFVKFVPFYLHEIWYYDIIENPFYQSIKLTSIVLQLFIAFFLILLRQKIELDIKIGLGFLSFLLLDFVRGYFAIIIPVPILLFLILPYLNLSKGRIKDILNIKKNMFPMLACFSIFAMMVDPRSFYYAYNIVPFLQDSIFWSLILLRRVFFISTFCISLMTQAINRH